MQPESELGRTAQNVRPGEQTGGMGTDRKFMQTHRPKMFLVAKNKRQIRKLKSASRELSHILPSLMGARLGKSKHFKKLVSVEE